MKYLALAIVTVALLSAGATARAQLLGADISATLRTQTVVSGTAFSEHSTPVTNPRIISALLATGSFSGLHASDFAIVYTNQISQTFEVINVHTKAVATVLAKVSTGSGGVKTAIENLTRREELDTLTATGFDFTLPGVTSTQDTNVLFDLRYTANGGPLKSFLYTFFGGNGFYANGTTFLSGTIKSNGKSY